MTREAQKIYNEIKTKGFLHEGNLIEIFYPKPVYPMEPNPEAHRKFWQYEANTYGGKYNRPVYQLNGEVTMENFECDYQNSLDKKTYSYLKELKDLGIIEEQNNSFNCYTYYLVH